MKLKTLLKRLGTYESIRALSANQYIIYLTNGALFQSYETIMGIKYKGETYVRDPWKISVTTSKYLYQFLYITEGKKELEKEIEKGKIKLFKE
jgi:hypothetical protein